MTTPTGTITMLDVILELDGVATPRQITLNDADVRGLAEVPTGEISMDDLRGKSVINVSVSGQITVDQQSFTDNVHGYILNVFGSVAGIVSDPPVIGVNRLFQGITDFTFTVNVVQDYRPFMQSIRIFGNGRDDTYVFETTNQGNNDTWDAKIANLVENSIFSPADIGLVYNFEVMYLA